MTSTAIKKAAIAKYPNIMCGVIKDDKFIELYNCNKDKQKGFALSYTQWFNVNKNKEVDNIVYSCIDPLFLAPTLVEMQDCEKMEVDKTVIFVDEDHTSKIYTYGKPQNTELIGREFIHGIQDSYSLCRDYYWQTKKIILPLFPRKWGWWNDETDLISKFKNFEFINYLHARKGDMFITYGNLSGILYEDRVALYHMGHERPYDKDKECLSKLEPLEDWKYKIVAILRPRV